jgi:phage shock protein C
MSRSPRLVRSKHNRVIAGVCGGLAERFGVTPTVMRLIYVIASLMSAAFPGLLVYIILWIVVPEE